MLKSLISLRKKTWLRLKFWKIRKIKEKLIEYPPASVFLSKADEIFNSKIEAERLGRSGEVEFYKGAQSVIDWINDYGKSN